MKKIITVFCIAWAMYCLIITGQQVAGMSWHYTLQQNPEQLQNAADDIFNQGARAALARRLNQPGPAALFAEGDGLKALALTYWLYPTEFIPYSNDPVELIFSKPPQPIIYFVGSQATYESNINKIPTRYKHEVITKSSGQVFALIKQR